MPKPERQTLLRQMWIFTHGLASLLTVGPIDDPRPESLIRTLADTGAAVIERSLGGERARGRGGELNPETEHN